MKRRTFINASVATGLTFTMGTSSAGADAGIAKAYRNTFSMNDNRASIYTHARVTPTKIVHITDTHLSLDDARGDPYQQFSKRMAAAYNSNSHFQSGKAYSAEESFAWTLETAQKEGAEFLALTGDILSFPSEAAVEWVCKKLEETGIPFAYIAGNHDWHYEGMPGSARELRQTWTAERLTPLYQGNAPLYAAYDFNGIRFVAIDDSTYEILPEQLAFFKEQTETGLPLVLLMHIPMYMPGRPIGFGCGHPDWGEKTDRNYDIERREKWPEEGHTQVTMDFCQAVFNARNLLAVLAGHTHKQSMDIKNGIPQLVSRENASAYYAEVTVKTYNG